PPAHLDAPRSSATPVCRRSTHRRLPPPPSRPRTVPRLISAHVRASARRYAPAAGRIPMATSSPPPPPCSQRLPKFFQLRRDHHLTIPGPRITRVVIIVIRLGRIKRVERSQLRHHPPAPGGIS